MNAILEVENQYHHLIGHKTFPSIYIHILDLDRNDPLIAILTSPYQGVVLSTNNGEGWQIGTMIETHLDEWEMYYGKVVLEN